MKLRHFIVFALLIVSGVVGGVLLVTSKSEVALIHFRDQDFDTALEQYEQRLSAGDVSASVVMPLCQLYLEFGNVDGAISLMKRFVRENPTDVEALKLLAKYFKYSQREDDYLRMLEIIAASSPSVEIQRNLLDIYRFRGDLDKQIKILQTLVNRKPSDADDFLALANLQAARGKLSAAAATIAALNSAHPESTSETIEFQIGLLLDSKQPEQAALRARQWISRNPNAEIAARMASLISSRGEHRRALDLLEPFETAANKNPVVLSVLTQVEVLDKKGDRALARLDRLNATGALPEPMLEQYVDLLLTQKRAAVAITVASKHDLSRLPAWLLSSLLRASLNENRLDFAGYMVSTLGEGFLDSFPVLGAHLAVARGDPSGAARWIGKAESRQLTNADKLDLASVYTETGRTESAIQLLESLVEDPHIPESAIRDLSSLYLDTQRAPRGLALLQRLKSKRHTLEVEQSWALLETAAGAEENVVDWLGAASTLGLEPDFLEKLYFAANDRNKAKLAAASSERLYANRGWDQDRVHLAEALLASGRWSDALDHLRALVVKGDPQTKALYAEALTTAEKHGAPVRKELQAFWSQQLSLSGLSREKQEEAAQMLLDLEAFDTVLPTLAALAHNSGGTWRFAYAETAAKAKRNSELVKFLRSELDRHDLSGSEKSVTLELLRQYGTDADALPYVRELAESRGGEWAFAYEEMLTRLGKRPELIAFWQKRSRMITTSVDEKRGIAFRSLDAGERNLAEEIFWDLAENERAKSQPVLELLFVWGPRPKAAALDWLEKRALASTGAEKASWVEHLINAGAAERAVRSFKGDEPASGRLRALSAAGDAAGIAEAIAKRLPLTSDPNELRELAKYATEVNASNSARAAYSKLLTIEPDDAEALRRLGGLDYMEGRLADAKDKLGRYLTATRGDFESHFYYADLLQQGGKSAAARGHFEIALAQIEGIDTKTIQMKTIHALALYRVGKLKESLSEFENLIKEQPDNKHLRADYVTVLIQSGRYHDAERLLDRP
jgi:cellulose synthase operon protein C